MRPSFSNFRLVIIILLKKVNLEVNWKVKCVGSCANGPKHLRQAWMMTLASESEGAAAGPAAAGSWPTAVLLQHTSQPGKREGPGIDWC